MKHLLFRDITEDDYRDNEFDYPKGFVIGDMGGLTSKLNSLFNLAEEFFRAADKLANMVLENEVVDYEIGHPILYLYRHSLELYLKSLTPSGNKVNYTHSLESLMEDSLECLKGFLIGKGMSERYDNAKKVILELHQLDSKSTSLRYKTESETSFEGFYCDLENLRLNMNDIKEFFDMLYGDEMRNDGSPTTTGA